MNAENKLAKAGGKFTVMAWLAIIFGVLAIMMPWVAGESILLLVGLLVIAAGLLRMIWAFQAGSLGKGILVFLIGALTLVAGVIVISHPLLTSAVLTIMLAVYFLIDGLSELFAAFSLSQGRGWLLFDAIVTIALGVLLFLGFPIAGTVAIGVFLGIKLLFVGITMLTLKTAVKSAAHKLTGEA